MGDEAYFDLDGSAAADGDMDLFDLDGDGSAAAAVGSGDVAREDLEFFDLDSDGSAAPSGLGAAGDGAIPTQERAIAPSGLVRGSPAWSQWMNNLRWGRRNTQVGDPESGLKDAWNLVPLRHGDQAASSSEDPRAGYSDRRHGDDFFPRVR